VYCAHTHFVIFIVGNHIPVVLLIFSAGPVNITWAEENVMVAAIFQCFYKVETDIITSITASSKGRAVKLAIMSVSTFKSAVILYT
jgi:hypothetical protein